MHMIHSNSAVDDHVDHRNLQAILDRRHTGRGHDRQLVLQILIINREIPLRKWTTVYRSQSAALMHVLRLTVAALLLLLLLLHHY